jgi:TPR repeat protein
MRNLTTTLCLIIALLVGSAGISWGADFQKGLEAANRGDFATALKEWRPLAEQGGASAQYNLGVRYAKGQGVLKDNVYAHMWANISASNGSENGGKNRDVIAKDMTPADISAAQNLARECVRKKYKGC